MAPPLLHLKLGKTCCNCLPLAPSQTVLMKELPLVYNKESLLNPFFVVFGERRPDGTTA